MRRSLGDDEDQGAEVSNAVRDHRRRARCVPDRSVNAGNLRSLAGTSACLTTCAHTGPSIAAYVLLSSRSRVRVAVGAQMCSCWLIFENFTVLMNYCSQAVAHIRCIVERVTRLPGQNRGSGTYGVAVRRRGAFGEPTASVAAGASWLFPGRLSPGRPTAEAEPALPASQHDLPDADGGARIRAPSEECVRLRSVLSGGGLSGLKQLHIAADYARLAVRPSAPAVGRRSPGSGRVATRTAASHPPA